MEDISTIKDSQDGLQGEIIFPSPFTNFLPGFQTTVISSHPPVLLWNYCQIQSLSHVLVPHPPTLFRNLHEK